MPPARALASRAILATNVKVLMARRKWKQGDLAAKAQISQTHVGNILRQETAATNEKIEAIAGAFKLPSWLLMVPNLPPDVLDSPQIPALVEHFTRLAIERSEP